VRLIRAVICGAMAVLVVGASARAQDLRLRVAWGGGEATVWHGTIAVEQGGITRHRALGIEPDEPGSMWIAEGRLMIRQRSPREYDAVDLDIFAPLDGRLIVSLEPAGVPAQRRVIEIELAKLVDGEHLDPLDERNSKLLVRRAPGDRLRVGVLNRSLVFSPGEPVHLQLQPHLITHESKDELVVVTKLTKARGGEEIWSNEGKAAVSSDGQGFAISPIQFDAPDKEGVYDLMITAKLPAKRRRFSPTSAFSSRDQVVARRVVQFVVIDNVPRGQSDDAEPPNKVVDEINPGKPWWKRVAELPKLPGLTGGPLENGYVGPWQHPTLGKMIQLGPGASDPAASWTAYPLSIAQPGQPHVLEVEYPSDVPQSMSISLLEPNAAGAVLPVGLDSGLYVPDDVAKSDPQIKLHRIVFWPRTEGPVVLITNRREDMPAVHGKIRVLGPKPFNVAKLHLAGSQHSRLPRAIPSGTTTEERLLAGYMERPLLPENFSATDAFDTTSGRSMDDWLTFYQAGDRLIEYLNYAGYNALFVSVVAAGSTIYPSEVLEPTPLYDSGTFFASGQDPIRKDVLEMLFRLCAREGIQLIPVMHFSSHLPQLEAVLRTGGPEADGVELLSTDGKAWQQKFDGVNGQTVYYNPLNGQVQRAMLAAVWELVQRYKHHPSFAGLAIGCSGHSYAMLPGPNWGYDERTIAEFAREAEIGEESGPRNSVTQRAVELQRKHQNRWLDWRAEKLRDFYGRVATELQSGRPSAKLFVATSKVVESPEVEQMLRPALPSSFRPADALIGLGIRPELYRQARDGEAPIVLLEPHLETFEPELSRRATSLQLDGGSGELTASFQPAGRPGSFFTVRPREVRLTSFEQKSPFGADATHALLVPHLVAAGAQNRQRFVHSLVTFDAQQIVNGGWMLPLGQEHELRDFVAAYRRLPAEPFVTVDGNHQPVTVRTLSRGRETFIYLANDSPWPCRATLRLRGIDNATFTELSGQRDVAKPARGAWSLKLQAYDFVAARFDAAAVEVVDVGVAVSDDVRRELQARVRDLSDRMAALGQPIEIGVLENPGFENADPSGAIAGWFLAGGPEIDARQDTRERFGGAASARLSSKGNVASLISRAIEVPRTGRLSFWVSLKTSSDFQGPLQLAVSARQKGRRVPYYRFASVGAEKDWRVFHIPTVDVPLDELEDLQIRFDLMGAGTVWLDEVRVSALDFGENERRELSKVLLNAHISLESGKYADCAHLLDSYWPRFLLEHLEAPRAVAARTRPDRQAELMPPREEETPKDEAWWKRALPGFLK
jgi:hypothetical protein